jgi:hypothetical protein
MKPARKRALMIAAAVLSVIVSLAGAVLLAGFTQQPLLDFFDRVIPGPKSNDCPACVTLAYMLMPVIVPVLFATLYRRIGFARAIAVAIARGPWLMLLACALDTWAARY